MCLSAIGDGASLPALNRAKNTGQSLTDLSNVLDTCTLENYGESQGKRCGSCCFKDLSLDWDCTAWVLSNCGTGEIIDFQCPPRGQSTNEDGKVCVELDCWSLNKACDHEPEDDLLDPCDDPCAICQQLRKDLLYCIRSKPLLGWGNSGKSARYGNLDANELRKEIRHYAKLCRKKMGRPRRIKIPCVEYCPPQCK